MVQTLILVYFSVRDNTFSFGTANLLNTSENITCINNRGLNT